MIQNWLEYSKRCIFLWKHYSHSRRWKSVAGGNIERIKVQFHFRTDYLNDWKWFHSFWRFALRKIMRKKCVDLHEEAQLIWIFHAVYKYHKKCFDAIDYDQKMASIMLESRPTPIRNASNALAVIDLFDGAIAFLFAFARPLIGANRRKPNSLRTPNLNTKFINAEIWIWHHWRDCLKNAPVKECRFASVKPATTKTACISVVWWYAETAMHHRLNKFPI